MLRLRFQPILYLPAASGPRPKDIPNPFALDLTASFLASLNPAVPPIIPGRDVALRFRVGDEDGASLALTGALVVMTIAAPASGQSFTRRSDTDIVGSSPLRKQISIDANQTTEDVITDPDHPTGKGWFEVRLGHETSDKQALQLLIGPRAFDMGLQLSSGTDIDLVRGRIEIVRAVTDAVQ